MSASGIHILELSNSYRHIERVFATLCSHSATHVQICSKECIFRSLNRHQSYHSSAPFTSFPFAHRISIPEKVPYILKPWPTRSSKKIKTIIRLVQSRRVREAAGMQLLKRLPRQQAKCERAFLSTKHFRGSPIE